jgi:hypothetical protein
VRKSASFTEQNWWQFVRFRRFDGSPSLTRVRWSGRIEHGMAHRMSQGRGVPSVSHTIFICCLSSLAKMFFGMSAWTPRTMSTTWVTRKLTAMLHRA